MKILKFSLSLWHIFWNIPQTGKYSSLEEIGLKRKTGLIFYHEQNH